jgi:arabinose-5-phosphate isomerase
MEKIMSTQNNIEVKDVMLTLDEFPVIKDNTIFKEALEEMGPSDIGMVCIVDNNSRLLGVITDGDIRRKLLKVQKPFSAFFSDDALDHAVSSPTTITSNITLKEAVRTMGDKKIWDIPVTNKQGILVGLLHLHPAIQKLLNE